MTLRNKTLDIDKASVARHASLQEHALAANEHQRPMDPVSALKLATSKHPSPLRAADILSLQRAIGNRAVQRMLSSHPHSPSRSSETSATAIQRQTEEEEPAQGKSDAAPRRENRTGMPDGLKSGIESLSGISLDHVRVHYGSAKPAQLDALAYTQGSDIHIGPGQEKHLAHEAWHVVQQAQGRVQPTMQLTDGVPVNDDQGLEQEADVMGARAAAVGQRAVPSLLFQGRAERAEAHSQRKPENGPLYFLSAWARSAKPQGVAVEKKLFHGQSVPVQRSAVVGLPGPDIPKVTYANLPVDLGPLVAAAGLAMPAPGWFAGWLLPHLQTLIQAPIAYTFDTALDVVRWILVRELMAELGQYTVNPANSRDERGKQMRSDLVLIRPLQLAYDAAGQASQQFRFCGRTYDLVNAGPRHHYASRDGHTILYSEDFTRSHARAVISHLRDHGRDARYNGPDMHVDNFVCAFLAEPTRWSPEHIFNLLATTQTGSPDDKIVGTSASALPMAGGSTWEPGLEGAAGMIAHGLPRRALQFAQSMGLFVIIDQELALSAGFPQLALAFRQQLTVTK